MKGSGWNTVGFLVETEDANVVDHFMKGMYYNRMAKLDLDSLSPTLRHILEQKASLFVQILACFHPQVEDEICNFDGKEQVNNRKKDYLYVYVNMVNVSVVILVWYRRENCSIL